jgi:hypothetical protein
MERCHICGMGIQWRSIEGGKAESNFKGLAAHKRCMKRHSVSVAK